MYKCAGMDLCGISHAGDFFVAYRIVVLKLLYKQRISISDVIFRLGEEDYGKRYF